MKIICIGRNFSEHAKELGNETPNDPVVFCKPDTALLRNNDPFFIPDFSNDIHHEVELVIKINRVGKNIQPKFASKYFDEIGLGIDFTARDLQSKLRTNGLPWEISKAFDSSAVISKKFINKSALGDLSNLDFSLTIDDQLVQKGSTNEMVFSFEDLICFVSKFFTLKIGDLIYTGTPAGVAPVKINDRLKGFIQEQQMFDFKVK
jgi:2-keto-4-pentenoate hydratase/2-oxohepta-3-ene-1,7-dioic acid hydratase in catechol pathway